jgi:Spy/CpxP family protein refolding chaperone
MLALGLAGLGAVVAGAHAAGPGGPHHGHHRGALMAKLVDWHVGEVLDELKATPEQREKVTRIKDQILAEAKTLHAGGRGLHQEIHALLQQDEPDAARIHELVDSRMAELRTFGHKLADAALEVHKVMTPEQRQQLAAHARDARGRMDAR